MQVDRQVVKDQFNDWLDVKKVSIRKREENAPFEENIIDAMEDGKIEITEENELKFSLNFPVQNDKKEISLSELRFKPFLKVHELNTKLKDVKPTDSDGRIVAYVSALTGTNKAMITELESTDYSICQAIVMYFL